MIFGLLTTMAFMLVAATYSPTSRNQQSRVTATYRSIVTIEQAIQVHEIVTGEYPKSIEDLTKPVGTFDKGILKQGALNDGWGTPFQIKFNGDEVKIRSAGPDKIMETADDITN